MVAEKYRSGFSHTSSINEFINAEEMGVLVEALLKKMGDENLPVKFSEFFNEMFTFIQTKQPDLAGWAEADRIERWDSLLDAVRAQKQYYFDEDTKHVCIREAATKTISLLDPAQIKGFSDFIDLLKEKGSLAMEDKQDGRFYMISIHRIAADGQSILIFDPLIVENTKGKGFHILTMYLNDQRDPCTWSIKKWKGKKLLTMAQAEKAVDELKRQCVCDWTPEMPRPMGQEVKDKYGKFPDEGKR